MTLSRTWKDIIGLATAWFAIYPLIFFVIWLTMFVGMQFSFLLSIPAEGNSSLPILPFLSVAPFLCVFPLHFCTILIGFGLMAFYLVHVIKNTKANDTVRIILGIGCFFMPFIAMPVYYYAFIWLDEPPAWAAIKSTADAP